VVGAAIVGVVLMPDLTRYARNTLDCVVASFLGQGGGIIIAYVLGMIPVLVWGELDPMTYMFIVGFGGIALAVLVFATWTTNVINLYSTALAARASVPVGRYRMVVVVCGIVGTAAAIIGVAEYLIDFLVVLGLLVPPIAGVYLCDFFFLGRTDFSPARLENRPAVKVNAMIAGVGSGIVATWMYYSDASLTTIAPVDSLLIALVVYLGLEMTSRKLGKA
jgi:cytosine permease